MDDCTGTNSASHGLAAHLPRARRGIAAVTNLVGEGGQLLAMHVPPRIPKHGNG